MKPNRLIKEQSPYLLQHAHNPVDWYAWGTEAFAKAKSMDKPILLSIGYSTCHWCHVMAHESFEDEQIAEVINEHFIPVKVDREERPEIDHIYMSAVTGMTGQGGWPLTVFLTPDAKPFYGGTYFPPYAKWGSVGFTDLLTNIAQGWANNRMEIIRSGDSITESLQANSRRDAKDSSLAYEDFLHRAYRQLSGQFDSSYGGFGSAPKFPMGHNLSFLLRYHQIFGESKALEIAGASLNAMASGGIKDHLGGGFHRYATDRLWHVPHFEKMLYDQALLARAYTEAFQVTGNLSFAKEAHFIFNYAECQMQDEAGGFYSAEDADSLAEGATHASEGAFYIFSAKEIQEALGKKAAEIFNFCYGIKEDGNVSSDPHGEFTGRNILYLANSIDKASVHFSIPLNEVEEILSQSRGELLRLRELRSRPFLDDKVLVDWNGLMIASLSFASRVLGEERYLMSARRCADFILSEMLIDGKLHHNWRKGKAAVDATLSDYAFLIQGLIELYEASFDEKYLDVAQGLAEKVQELFKDEQGGFFMTAQDGEALILRPKEGYDGAIPSGNSVMVLNLLRLYAFTGKEVYSVTAQGTINAFKADLETAPGAHTYLLGALAFDVAGPWEILLEGPSCDAPEVAKCLRIVYKCFRPNMALRFRLAGQVKVYLCRRGVCQLPFHDASALEQALSTS